MKLRLVSSGVVAIGMFGATILAGAAPDPEFGAHWHDGKAELNGYRITVERYGAARQGRAVSIYVTEPFSRSRNVKLDDPAKSPGDALEVLKLNLVRDFQTGIYDYHTSLSLFVNSIDFTPVKSAFSSSEWCGQVFEEMTFSKSRLSQRVSSYFDGESSETTRVIPPGGVQEDALFITLRGLRGPYLEPGEMRTVPLLPSPFHRRLTHREAAWTDATIQRRVDAEKVTVPAGTFSTDVFVVRTGDGREALYHVERSFPHRIVRWTWRTAAGQRPFEGSHSGELTGSTRLEYWKTLAPGDEKYLERLGLGVRGGITPDRN